MKFSIIVPVYNAEQYLPACIASVSAQTYADHELILVDDGSAPACARACDAAAENDTRIRVIHQKNAGQLYARLRGAKAAAGEYCLFLDADDLLLPDCLQKLSDAIERYGAPDLLIYSYYTESPDGTRQKKPPLFEEERLFTSGNKEALYRRFFSGTGLNNVWTKAAKRSVFDGAHPDYARFAALRCAEDRVQAMVMVSNADTAVYLPEPMYVYRLTAGSVTRRFSSADIENYDTRAVYPFEIECLKSWGLYSAESVQRLDASYVAQTLYVFDLFYRNRPDKETQDALVDFPWKQLLPEESLAGYKDNPYLNDVQKKLAAMLLCGDKQGLRLFFKRKKRIAALRALKRKMIP